MLFFWIIVFGLVLFIDVLNLNVFLVLFGIFLFVKIVFFVFNSMGILFNVFLLYLGFDDVLDKLNINVFIFIFEFVSKNFNWFLGVVLWRDKIIFFF